MTAFDQPNFFVDITSTIDLKFKALREHKSQIKDPNQMEKMIKDWAKLAAKKIKAKYFYHIDLYRIDDEKDILGLEIEEIINDSRNIIAIEWPEKMKKILPKNISSIYFEYIDDNQRRVEFK